MPPWHLHGGHTLLLPCHLLRLLLLLLGLLLLCCLL
jgi:hypothetical protein